MGLTTLLGTAQLAIQDVLRKDVSAGRTPNVVIVSIGRAALQREYVEGEEEAKERMRRELEGSAARLMEAHGWTPGGCGVLSLAILVRSTHRDCQVLARTVNAFARLTITDDAGSRVVPLVTPRGLLGRDHKPIPPGFIPLHDSLRLVSRDHISLTYRDLELTATLHGRNPTTLNGHPMTLGTSIALAQGDVIRCGSCEIAVNDIEGRD